tara:strand:+ start:109 stop:537 length:429 start_codon:yes stop_codon:yes gene_type:complete
MTTFLSGIPANGVDEVWEQCESFIELASKKGQREMTIEDIRNFCKDKTMQLWVVHDEKATIQAVVTTQIIDYPRKKVCRIISLGGKDMDKWLDSIRIIEEWADAHDCVAMETFCRKGFIKKLEKYSYEQIYAVLGKELKTIH